MSTADAAGVMREVAYGLYAPAIIQQHRRTGGQRLREVLSALHSIYRRRTPETFGGGLTVFASIDPTLRPHCPVDPLHVDPAHLNTLPWDGCAIQVLPNGKLLAWESQPSDVHALSEVAVVYVWSPEQEAFAVSGEMKYIPNPNGYPSAFASPGYFLLEDALVGYEQELARRSRCQILRHAWHDDKRLLFSNKPERTIRQSLAQHLKWALRDHAEVREEQNVTETRPIDVKVTWATSELLSLIEIKWLGKSVNASGTSIGKIYSAPGRVSEGIKQLIEYLEGNLDDAPRKPCKGYLVVYDGRRRGITAVPPDDVTPQQAWYYSADDLSWPTLCPDRSDLAEPKRLYLEPAIPRPSASQSPRMDADT